MNLAFLETAAPFLAGPAAALLIMLLVLAALYQVTTKQLIPLLSAAATRHLNALDELVKTNREDHQAIIVALKGLEHTLERAVEMTDERRRHG